MRRRLKNRIGLSLLFSIVVLVLFLITALIVGAISFILIKAGLLNQFSRYGHIVQILIVLLACVIVGTIISPVMGRFALKSIHKVIAAINQLASGDFSVRLDRDGPPEVHKLAESFNLMAEELGGLELLRTDFVNNFSHEFKTPIVSIKGFAEMLKYDDLTPEERHEYLDIVISESSRLAALATNVLNLSKVENKTILTDKHSFNIGEQVRNCILLLQSKWEQKRILLTVEIKDVWCCGNEELLYQVWLNLFDNAVKFTPEGSTIGVMLDEVDGKAVFTLRDSGDGISADAVEHIFDKFYQADTSHATAGNGLGLTLAQKIVLLHDGSIVCKSVLGEGTAFIVELPIK